LPAQFVDGIHAVTAAVSCRQCSHSHFLVEPRGGGGRPADDDNNNNKRVSEATRSRGAPIRARRPRRRRWADTRTRHGVDR
jgi:hypothetical protein